MARRLKAASGTGPTPKPHVILISLDTLRADHLSCYGYFRETSPNLDLIAAHGVRFTQAFSQAPRTAPSHMTMFTGLYPSLHHTHFAYSRDGAKMTPLSKDVITLPMLFKQAGYATAAWTGGGEVVAEAGFGRGFDEVHETVSRISTEKMRVVAEWFKANAAKPCFIFLHTYQIHDPYLPPPPYNKMFDPSYQGWVVGDEDEIVARAGNHEWNSLHRAFWDGALDQKGLVVSARVTPRDVDHLIALYDGNIRYTDLVLAGFFRDLIRDGLLDHAIVVITADHGEEFAEHGGFLHKKLYQETLHVPLIIFSPSLFPEGRAVGGRVGLIDLPETILQLAGLSVPSQFMGRSLEPAIEGEGVFDTVYSEDPWAVTGSYIRGLRSHGYFLYDQGPNIELYDIGADPMERFDLADERKPVLAAMRRELGAFEKILAERSRPAPLNGPVSDENLKQLRALGYVK